MSAWFIVDDDEIKCNIQLKLKNLYTKLLNHHIANNYDKQKMKIIVSLIAKFDLVAIKNDIFTKLCNIYTKNKNFILKLDANNHLIGFNNGVYDLKKFEFRKCVQEDYISMSVGYDYQENYDTDLLKFLEYIQPNKKEREYMLTFLSICLIGNQLDLFTVLTGNKNKLIELLKMTFGDYFGVMKNQSELVKLMKKK